MNQKNEDNDRGFQVELPSDVPDDIIARLYLPFKEEDIDLETELTDEEIEAARAVTTPFRPFKTISYFKIRDKKGNLITAFDPPLELNLEYSYAAWFESQEQEFWQIKGRPRVYYLGKYGKTWAERWDEFSDEGLTANPPAKKKSPGFITISIANLPDPRIGGC